MPNIQVIRENSLGVSRGLYTDWMGNALSDANSNQLISEGAAVITTVTNPKNNVTVNSSNQLVGPDGSLKVGQSEAQAARTDIAGAVIATDNGLLVMPSGQLIQAFYKQIAFSEGAQNVPF